MLQNGENYSHLTESERCESFPRFDKVSWFVPGLFMACCWFAVGLFLVCSCFVLGLFLVCSWFALGFLLVSCWFLAAAAAALVVIAIAVFAVFTDFHLPGPLTVQ